MELADGLGENRPAKFTLLPEPASLREPASVRSRSVGVELNGVNHTVAVKEVVAGDGAVERVSPVSEVHAAANTIWDFPGDLEVVGDGTLRDGSEVAGDLDLWVGSFGEGVVLALVGDEGGFHDVEGGGGGFLEGVPLGRGGGVDGCDGEVALGE